MSTATPARPEAERIAFLVARDGEAAAREWVVRTLGIYRSALGLRTHQACDPAYRPRFEQAVREFEAWLAGATADADRGTSAAD